MPLEDDTAPRLERFPGFPFPAPSGNGQPFFNDALVGMCAMRGRSPGKTGRAQGTEGGAIGPSQLPWPYMVRQPRLSPTFAHEYSHIEDVYGS
jgi:hypothetical protein